jgi:uncharacterized protein (TIGR02145 family)
VPTDSEWVILTDYLGETAGGKLKEVGTIHWIDPNTGATNESGFIALPGGRRDYLGAFSGVYALGLWWSATKCDGTECGTTNALYRYMYFNSSDVTRNFDDLKSGYSVRCIKD